MNELFPQATYGILVDFHFAKYLPGQEIFHIIQGREDKMLTYAKGFE